MLPWLLGSEYIDLAPDLRKALEVALHAGATLALLSAWSGRLGADLMGLDARALQVLVLASAPAAVAGYLLEDLIECRLGHPRPIAGASLLGGAALALADRRPERRRAHEATATDAAWLGAAQALALVPGVSRSGATLTAARFRGFRRADAAALSHRVGLPVTIGAIGLKTWRLIHGGGDRTIRGPLAAGAASSFASTLLAARLMRGPAGARPLWPYAVYRTALAALILTRSGSGGAARAVGHDAQGQGHAGSA